MARQRAIDMALDLARMPAFVASMAVSPLPDNVLEVIRIAGESPEACRAAALSTGQPEPVLIEAARFYLQQVLFRPDADCYRVLGIGPDESLTLARTHMRCLLQWLHPDRNGSWDAIYAKRVVTAWREVSNRFSVSGNSRPTVRETESRGHTGRNNTAGHSKSFRLPWIERPYENVSARGKNRWFATRVIKVAAGLAFLFVLLALTAPASGDKSVALRIISVLW